MSAVLKDPSIYAARKRANLIGLVLSMSAMAIGLVFLLWILTILLFKGFSALSFSLLTQSTPAPGSEGGGLANAIVGSLMIVMSCSFLSTPIGVLAGVYLSEYGDRSKMSFISSLSCLSLLCCSSLARCIKSINLRY